MKFYSYLVEHDFGLAPNPFGGYCTLTVCKPQIRKSHNLQINDWIVGTGSKALSKTFNKNLINHLIFAMRVSEIIPLENYWVDNRFQCKKPILNGSLALMYGDNIYHKDQNGNWVQEDSAHSYFDGTPNLTHLKSDVGGENAIIANHFYYFGQEAPSLPKSLWDICKIGRGQKFIEQSLGMEFVFWLEKEFEPKIHGKPINWVIYDQQILI